MVTEKGKTQRLCGICTDASLLDISSNVWGVRRHFLLMQQEDQEESVEGKSVLEISEFICDRCNEKLYSISTTLCFGCQENSLEHKLRKLA